MTFRASFNSTRMTFGVGFTASGGGSFDVDMGTGGTSEVYAGDYTITPKVTEQVLHTKGKAMADDVTVEGVPIYIAANNSGGNTVYIAREIS